MSECSTYLNPQEWRLSTDEGNIPYRLVSRSGSIAVDEYQNTGSAEEVVLIQDTDLRAFADAILPSFVDEGGYSVWKPKKRLARNIDLFASEITWKTHVPGLPIDPFLTDVGGPENTYHSILEVTIKYVPLAPEDDRLIIRADTSGEFIHTSPSKGDIAAVANRAAKPQANSNPNRLDNLPLIITVPITYWTVTWPNLAYSVWQSDVQDTLKSMLGKVNEDPMTKLHDADPQTVLFTGYSWRRHYTWYNLDDYPVHLELKFKEKHVDWDGKVHGHNSIFIPAAGGWARATIDNAGAEAYEQANLNDLFTLI